MCGHQERSPTVTLTSVPPPVHVSGAEHVVRDVVVLVDAHTVRHAHDGNLEQEIIYFFIRENESNKLENLEVAKSKDDDSSVGDGSVVMVSDGVDGYEGRVKIEH